MKQKKYYETPSIDIIEFSVASILTVSQGTDMTPSGDYDQDGEWN